MTCSISVLITDQIAENMELYNRSANLCFSSLGLEEVSTRTRWWVKWEQKFSIPVPPTCCLGKVFRIVCWLQILTFPGGEADHSQFVWGYLDICISKVHLIFMPKAYESWTVVPFLCGRESNLTEDARKFQSIISHILEPAWFQDNGINMNKDN